MAGFGRSGRERVKKKHSPVYEKWSMGRNDVHLIFVIFNFVTITKWTNTQFNSGRKTIYSGKYCRQNQLRENTEHRSNDISENVIYLCYYKMKSLWNVHVWCCGRNTRTWWLLWSDFALRLYITFFDISLLIHVYMYM